MGVIRRIEIVMPVHEYLREIVLAEKARKKKRLRCLQARPVESLLPSPTTWISVEDLLRKEGQDGGTLALRLEDDKADERPFCLSSFRVLSVLSSANRPLLLQCRDADGEEKALIFKTDDNMDNDRLCQDIARWLDAEIFRAAPQLQAAVHTYDIYNERFIDPQADEKDNEVPTAFIQVVEGAVDLESHEQWHCRELPDTPSVER